jgi:hypothetical protein
VADAARQPEATTWDLDDLATHTDLAALFRVGPSAVVNWTNRHDDFPAPLVICSGGSTPIYSVRQIVAWWLEIKVGPDVAEAFRDLERSGT